MHEFTLIASEQFMWATLLTRMPSERLSRIATSICYPSKEDAEVISLASKIATLFRLNSSGGEDEILKVRANINGAEVKSSWTVLELSHRGTPTQGNM